MLKIHERYAPRANVPDSNYPLGSVKNESVPGADDGTPLEKDWGNNIEGFHQALLADAGIVANGLVERVGESQLLTAIKSSTSTTVASVIELRKIIPLKDGQTVSVAGYTALGDGCQFTAQWNASGTPYDDGITGFKAASSPSSGVWKASPLGAIVDAARIGIFPSNTPAENSSRLNTAIPVCLAEKANVINFTKQIAFDATVVSRLRSQISFTGIQPTGLYRKFSQEITKQNYIPQNDIIPHKHLWKARNTDTPVVVLMGDSISTSGPDGYTTSSDMWSVLCSEMVRKNPTKLISFLNRSVGGQTWPNANTKPTVFPPEWYTNSSLDWLDVIKADAPDVIFLAFGMNDANGFNAGAVNAVVTKINAWAKVPNIIFITNPVPALSTSYQDGFGFVAAVFQEGRDQVAGYVRGYAKQHGYGIIDLNRAQTAMRDGYDVVKNILFAEPLFTGPAYAGSAPVIDWGIIGSVSGAAAWPVGKVLSLKSGLSGTDQIFVVNEAGKFKILGFSDDGATPAVVTNVPVPAAAFEIGIGVVDNVAILTVNRNTIAVTKVVRQGGTYLPIIGWQGDLTNGPFTTIQFSEGYPQEGLYQKSLTDEDIFGPSDASAARKMPYGGNGVNHFSSYGIEKLVRPVFEVANLTIETTPQLSFSVITPSAPATSTGIEVRSDGTTVFLNGMVTPTANAQVIFVIPAGFRPSVGFRKPCAALVAPYSVLLKVETNGNVTCEAGWTSGQLDLSSISFHV